MDELLSAVKGLPSVKQRAVAALLGAVVADAAGSTIKFKKKLRYSLYIKASIFLVSSTDFLFVRGSLGTRLAYFFMILVVFTLVCLSLIFNCVFY